MNSSVFKSPSPLTRPLSAAGEDKTNRSVTVTVFCACLFDRMAKAWRMAVNPMLRRFIACGAEAENHPQSLELRRALCIPSIYDPTTPEGRAGIIEQDISTLRPHPYPVNIAPYLEEFTQ